MLVHHTISAKRQMVVAYPLPGNPTNRSSITRYGLMLVTLLLTVLLTAIQLRAQAGMQQRISYLEGTVTDMNNTPLAGVQVFTVPFDQKTATDGNGYFKIAVTDVTKQITLYKPGFQRQTVAILPGQSPIEVKLIAQRPARDQGNASQPLAEAMVEAAAPKMQAPPNQLAMSSYAQAKAIGGYTASSGGNYMRLPSINTESYAHVQENGFKSTQTAPFSTFSIDVDKAAYSNVRRFIEQGSLPPADAVRIEELINYFDYQYAQPEGKDPVAIHSELSLAPWNNDHYLLRIGLQAKKVATEALPASNLVFLIDVSGSMYSPNKLPLLVSSFKMLTDQLREQDYVSIVTYAGSADEVLEPTSGAEKAKIKSALDKLQANGSTNGAGGLEKAYGMAEKHFLKQGNNRIVLASDGDFNVGASGLSELEALITEKRKSGIFLSVLGFGMGNYKDDKMELLADKGNGNYAYIDNSSEARRVLLKEFGGTLFTVAKDVKVQVEFNPALVQAYRLIGYENRALADEDFNRDTVDAGEMGSGNTVTALYEIIPVGVKDAFTPALDSFRYTANQTVSTGSSLSKELAMVKIRYKAPNGEKSNLITRVIDRKTTPLNNTSANFQLAAAAASWGMILKNSPYQQNASCEAIIHLLQNAITSDKTGQAGAFLTLVATSQALVGNEVKTQAHTPNPPVRKIMPQPKLRKFQAPRGQKPPVVKIIPLQGTGSTTGTPTPAPAW